MNEYLYVEFLSRDVNVERLKMDPSDYRKFPIARARNPKQPVGMMAAQSLSQPMTQIALSSFHSAGTLNSSGTSRMEEIINATFLNSSSSCRMRMKSLGWDNPTKELVYITVGDMVKGMYFVNPSEKDSWWYTLAEEEGFYKRPSPQNGSVLRIEVDKDKMLNHQITLLDLSNAIRREVIAEGIDALPSPEFVAIIDLVIRLRPNPHGSTSHPNRNEKRLTKVMNILIGKIRMGGIERILAARRIETKHQVEEMRGRGPRPRSPQAPKPKTTIETRGTHLRELIKHPDLDTSSITSSCPQDTMGMFGIEAARKVIVEELSKIVDGRIRYDNKHVNLLADYMTSLGDIASIKRSSKMMRGQSVLSRASYEDTMRELIDACTKGSQHEIRRTSESIIVGAKVSGIEENEGGALVLPLLEDEGRESSPST